MTEEPFIENPIPEDAKVRDYNKAHPLERVDDNKIITDQSGSNCHYNCPYHSFYPPKDSGELPFTLWCYLFDKKIKYEYPTIATKRLPECFEKFGDGPFLKKRKKKKK